METKKDVMDKLKQMDSDRRNLMSESQSSHDQGFARSGHRRQDEADEIQGKIDKILGSSKNDVCSEFEAYLDRLTY